jgi:tRNA(Arg) A34 adenosine deaminase TadA
MITVSKGGFMNDRDISSEGVDRREFLTKSAAVAGAAGGSMGAVAAAQAQAQCPEPPPPLPELEEGFNLSAPPLVANWPRRVGDMAQVDFDKEANELNEPAVQERHHIYSYLLMKLIHRFWNGNKNGPVGTYPQRSAQLEQGRTDRYRGDIQERSDRAHIPWDRYLGHNIACVAVDKLGQIIDFDFNHNAFFRSTAEHAESRLVRRLFSLTDGFDNWRVGRNVINQPRAALLSDVALYTSLESCAQCSGVMSLAGVKQVIYMQNDFTAYKIGNIMFNLANRSPVSDDNGHVIKNPDGTDKMTPSAPIPIPASKVGLDRFFKDLNDGNIAFGKKMRAGSEAFYKSVDGNFVDRDPSITSFLCTDTALNIFKDGADQLDKMVLQFKNHPFAQQATPPPQPRMLTNEECLNEAIEFYKYVDVKGYRGSPHKL